MLLRSLLILAGLACTTPALAATIPVAPGGLADALAAAKPGDVLALAPGVHYGPIKVTTPVSLIGEPGAVIDGKGEGHVVHIIAPGVTVRGVEVRNSGLTLFDQNAGIFLGQEAHGAVIEGNRIIDNLIGIYVWGANDTLVRDNVVNGRTDLRVSERGNGIQIWNAPGTKVVGNTVRDGRDGIFVTTSKQNLFQGNRFERVRFAVHYMYTNKSEVSDNVSIGNDVGYAIMYSNDLVIRNNRSERDRDHGFLLNYANNSAIEGNVVAGRFTQTDETERETVADQDMPRDLDGPAHGQRFGTWKCVFIYNANKNRFTGNRFEGCEIGVHFTAGSERNAITGNAFIDNRTQVKYVGTRHLDWSHAGRGNYWSDNAAFDLNGDGIADEAYRPNDVIDRVMWAYPAAKLLMNGPGVQVIRWAQKQFPALHPGGVVDSAPLMNPPTANPPPPAVALASPQRPQP